ncbi:uncharacterized protein At4g33100 isoform X1 [Silene latifolia]|uniref:uncharacterized protein At4g33100 isoform X1 n=1 Tax=Silene latifolia TaxID=37657 RepID=UPI003D77230F
MGIFKKKASESPTSSPCSTTSPCAHLRTAYHNCFNNWYSEKFVKGQWQNEECVAEWQKYRTCLSQHLEDKQLSKFLEAEASGFPSVDRFDASKPAAN